MSAKRVWWVRWFESSADYRPLRSPPGPAILGWWCTGYSGDAAVLVAWVIAPTEEKAKAAILRDWPSPSPQWSFCNETDLSSPGDRFPLKPWTVRRVRKARARVKEQQNNKETTE